LLAWRVKRTANEVQSGRPPEKYAPFLLVILITLLYLALMTPGVDPITTDWVRPVYVVLDGGFAQDEQYLTEAIAKAPARFDAVYQNARFHLMRYQPDASANWPSRIY